VPAARLTDRKVASIRAPRAGRREYPDAIVPGLAFRITDGDAKSWTVRTRVNGRQLRVTLGPYPRISLAAAREKARRMLDLADKGKDPRLEMQRQRDAETRRQADTFAAVAEQFIERHAKQRRWPEFERILRRDVIPKWRHQPISEISRRDVTDLLETIADRAPIQANRTLVVVRKLFNWSLDRGIIQHTPTARMRRPTEEKPRERVLSDDELRAFWKACTRLGWPFGPLLQLLAITAQRKGEIGGLQWPEIHRGEKQIELVGSKYKTGRPHIVPLPDAAIAIIDDQPTIGTESGFVFTTNDRTPVSGFSKAKAELDGYMLEELRRDAPKPGKVKLEPWIIHDLRRTARSNFSKLGIAADISERVLGHVISGIRGIYDRHDYLDEKRRALELWAAELQRIVGRR